jgi:hypothetical protein
MKSAPILRVFVSALAFVLGASSLRAQNESQKTDVIVYDKVVPGVTAPKPVYHPDAEYTERAGALSWFRSS